MRSIVLVAGIDLGRMSSCDAEGRDPVSKAIEVGGNTD